MKEDPAGYNVSGYEVSGRRVKKFYRDTPHGIAAMEAQTRKMNWCHVAYNRVIVITPEVLARLDASPAAL